MKQLISFLYVISVAVNISEFGEDKPVRYGTCLLMVISLGLYVKYGGVII